LTFYFFNVGTREAVEFTEDPNLIDYSKYKERLRTALTGMLEVRNYSKADINQMLELVEPKKQKREKK
jgi:hypothetical protein